MPTPREDAERTAAVLESAVRASVDAIVVHDADGRVATWGPAAEQMYGYTAQEAIGRHVLDFAPPAYRDAADAILARARAGEAVPPMEGPNLNADGERIPVEVSLAPVRDGDGAPTGMTIAVIRDIRPRVEARRAAGLLGAIVSNADVAIYAFDVRRQITTWSAGAQRMFGWTIDDIAEDPVAVMVPPEHADEARRLVAGAFRGESAAVETQRLAKDGRSVDVLVSISPVRDDTGSVIGASVVAQDISERRAAERRAELERARMGTVLDHVGSSVFLKDRDGRYMLVNQRFRELWGPPDGPDPIGLTDAELGAFDREAAERFRAEDEDVMTSGAVGTIESRFPDNRGVEHDFITIKVPVRGADGAVVGVCGIDHEVTELRSAERELAERAGALMRSNADLDAFATAVSHDLQEPLRVVELAAEVLGRLSSLRDDVEMGELTETIALAARRLIDQVDGLLELARVRDEVAGPPTEPVPADDALDDALDGLQVSIAERGARIRREPLPALRVDRIQLARVFQNLVGNAIKFAAEGERPEISIVARDTGDGWEIDVADHGIGFDPAATERIFAPFRTAHDREHHPGLGVGLALCRRICERYGATVTARSQPGAGATFTLRFPR